jgi:hypothetical protein
MVAVDGWTKQSTVRALDLALRFEDAGVAAIIYTDIDRDGAMGGVNVDATITLAQHLTTPVIASGGVSSLDDLRELRPAEEYGIVGAIVGRALYTTLLELVRWQGFFNAFAMITTPNPGSIGLHQSFGFTPAGVTRRVGFKLGHWHDVGTWELALRLPSIPTGLPTVPEAIHDTPEWRHAFVADKPANDCVISSFSREANQVFPVWRFDSANSKHENFSPQFRASVDVLYEHHYTADEIVGYIYAVLHTPTYRKRYAEFLRIDFPRVRFPEAANDFENLSGLGWALIEAHLLRELPHPRLATYNGKGDHTVEAVRYSPEDHAIAINNTQFFNRVPPAER